MSRRRARNMSELNKQINKILIDVLNKENSVTANVIKETESDMVEQEVYAKYQSDSESPYRYMRRGADGWGLADTRNMKHEAAEIDGKVKMQVLNLTEGVVGHKGEANLKTGQLAHLVEGGDGAHGLRYSYGDGSFREKRPFQKETVKTLKGNKEHIGALKYELRVKGLNVR